MKTPAERLVALRHVMKQRRVDAWIVPTADPHLSEYLPDRWQTRAWLSGFSGSAGTLVVTLDEAVLWADSRYWEQAESQLAGSGIRLAKLGVVPGHMGWLAETLPKGAVVGIAPDMLSLAAKRQFEAAFSEKGILLRYDSDITGDFFSDRPGLPCEKIYLHDKEYVVQGVRDKLARVRSFMKEKKAGFHLVSALDDIAWLTNLRGNDVAYNPVFLAHMLIGVESAVLFVDEKKLDGALRRYLEDAGVELAGYEALGPAVGRIEGGLLLQPSKIAMSSLQCLSEKVELVESVNPAALFKAVKSDGEVAFIRETMRKDGAALCGFFAEFERRVHGGEVLTELDVADMLTRHRSLQTGYVSPSFGTIAGFNANGALPHYSATPDAFSEIVGKGLLLIDSGAQYQGGTTDITRVVPVGGEPEAEQKRDYTLVLKAHIALALAVFPENIPGPMLDAVCRMPLWQRQCEYGHGTGHGVGYFLNVHEGPQVISYKAGALADTEMKAGMLTSNEPGLYRSGKWGIRIENLVVSRYVDNPAETDFGVFLCFETLTLCPIDTRLIDKSLLTAAELTWLNRYHENVREQLACLVEGEAEAWLLEHTRPV